MKVFITGGTGFVGTALTRSLAERGHQVTVLTRRSPAQDRPGSSGVRLVQGNANEEGPWQEELLQHDAVINLAGASIFRRWTKAAKKEIRESRLRTTRNLVGALGRGAPRPGFRFLSASAVGIYGFHGDEVLDEENPPGDDFLAVLARDWEGAAEEAEAHGAVVTCMRFGIVLGKEEGALPKMLPLYRWWLGGPLGSGRQWFSWVHIRDLAAIHLFALEREDLRGPLNCTAPGPVRNKDMARTLAGVMGKPSFMPGVPGFLVRAALGEFGSVLLEGQRVAPKRLQEAGFRFLYPELQPALEDLLGSGPR